LLFYPETFEDFIGDGITKLTPVAGYCLLVALLEFLEGDFFIVDSDGGISTVHHIGAHAPKDKNQSDNQDQGLDNDGLRFVAEDLQHGNFLEKRLFLSGSGKTELILMPKAC
jgi:hypothetical protein